MCIPAMKARIVAIQAEAQAVVTRTADTQAVETPVTALMTKGLYLKIFAMRPSGKRLIKPSISSDAN